MREILFRGRRVDNGEWVYGSFIKFSNNKTEIHTTFDEELKIGIITSGLNEVISDTIGQFTGLTDKNGTKIFEGDIFEYGYVVTWVDESSNGSHGMFTGWYLQRNDFESWEELSVGYSYEVIGNIY